MCLSSFSELLVNFRLCVLVRFIDDLLEGEQHIHHSVLKENGQAGDNASFFVMLFPVFPLMENLNICKTRRFMCLPQYRP